MDQDPAKTIKYWAENLRVTQAGAPRRLNFWDVASALQEQGRIAFPEFGQSPPELPAIRLLREKAPNGKVSNGISIGCGSGHKELMLLQAGVVEHFTLVEIVPELLTAGRETYAAAGYGHRATFVEGDFEQCSGQMFDLIYFDNALHHMFEVPKLIPRILEFLRPGGFFVMDDFVGPTYNQFSEAIYAYADHVRRLLPRSMFEGEDGDSLRTLGRIPVQAYLDTDPSEACDSSAILPTIARHMRGVEIIPTGGLIYYLACREIFDKLIAHPDRDDAIIRLLFELDRVLVKANPDLTCYALAIWRKPESAPAPLADADWKASIRWPDWKLPI